jgi:hypothetical protein
MTSARQSCLAAFRRRHDLCTCTSRRHEIVSAQYEYSYQYRTADWDQSDRDARTGYGAKGVEPVSLKGT